MTKKIVQEFTSVDNQSVLPDPVVGKDAHRAADQSQGETNYSMTTKSEVMAAILNDLQNRPANEVLDVYKSISSTNDNVNKRPADKTAGELGTIRTSPTAVTGQGAMESVGEIFTGQELSEDLKTKAAIIFEATVNSRISIIETNLQEQYETALEEAVSAIHAELVENVDRYLTYVAEEWKDENKLSITNGIKVKMAEDAMNTLKAFFSENYITFDEEKTDVLEAIVAENDELKARLNESLEKIISLEETIENVEIKDIVSEAAVGLAMSQKEKLFNLVENISYNNTEELKGKIATIKETYFGTTSKTASTPQSLVEDVNGTLVEDDKTSAAMSPYVDALRRTSKQ